MYMYIYIFWDWFGMPGLLEKNCNCNPNLVTGFKIDLTVLNLTNILYFYLNTI